MFAILGLIHDIAWFLEMVIIAQVVLSWLVAFGAVDRYNRIVVTVGDTLTRLTEPMLRPVRELLYRLGLNLGGLDLSPLIVLLLLGFIPQFLDEMLLPAANYIR